jgi:hypothetical protein
MLGSENPGPHTCYTSNPLHLFLVFFVFWNRVSLCSQGWSCTCNPVSASQLLEFQVSATLAPLHLYLIKHPYISHINCEKHNQNGTVDHRQKKKLVSNRTSTEPESLRRRLHKGHLGTDVLMGTSSDCPAPRRQVTNLTAVCVSVGKTPRTNGGSTLDMTWIREFCPSDVALARSQHTTCGRVLTRKNQRGSAGDRRTISLAMGYKLESEEESHTLSEFWLQAQAAIMY